MYLITVTGHWERPGPVCRSIAPPQTGWVVVGW